MGQNFWQIVAETGRAAGAGYGGLLERKQAITEQQRQERIRQGEFVRSMVFQKLTGLERNIGAFGPQELATPEGQQALREAEEYRTILMADPERVGELWNQRQQQPPEHLLGFAQPFGQVPIGPQPAVQPPPPAFVIPGPRPPVGRVLAETGELARTAEQRRVEAEEARRTQATRDQRAHDMLVQIAHNAQGIYTPQHQAMANAALRDPNANFVEVLSRISPIAVTVLETRENFAAARGVIQALPEADPIRMKLERDAETLEPLLAQETLTPEQLARFQQFVTGTEAQVQARQAELQQQDARTLQMQANVDNLALTPLGSREPGLFTAWREARTANDPERMAAAHDAILRGASARAVHDMHVDFVTDLYQTAARGGAVITDEVRKQIDAAMAQDDLATATSIVTNLIINMADQEEKLNGLRHLVTAISNEPDMAAETRARARELSVSDDVAALQEFVTQAQPQLTAAFQKTTDRIALEDTLTRINVEEAGLRNQVLRQGIQREQYEALTRAAVDGGVDGLDRALAVSGLPVEQQASLRLQLEPVALRARAANVQDAVTAGMPDLVSKFGGTAEQVQEALNNKNTRINNSIIAATESGVAAQMVSSIMQADVTDLFIRFGRAGRDMTPEMLNMTELDPSLAALHQTYLVLGAAERAEPERQRVLEQVSAIATNRPEEAEWPTALVQLKGLLQEAGFKPNDAKLVANGIVDGWRRNASSEALENMVRQANLANLRQRATAAGAAVPGLSREDLAAALTQQRALYGLHMDTVNTFTDRCLTSPDAGGMPRAMAPQQAGDFGHLGEVDQQWCRGNLQGFETAQELAAGAHRAMGEIGFALGSFLGLPALQEAGIAQFAAGAQAQERITVKRVTEAENVMIGEHELRFGKEANAVLTQLFRELVPLVEREKPERAHELELEALTAELTRRGISTAPEDRAILLERGIPVAVDHQEGEAARIYFSNMLRGAVGGHVGEGVYTGRPGRIMGMFHAGTPQVFQGDLTDPAYRGLLLSTTGINDPFLNQFNHVTVASVPFGFVVRGVKGTINPGPVIRVPFTDIQTAAGEPALGRDATAQVIFYDTMGNRITDPALLDRILAAQQ